MTEVLVMCQQCRFWWADEGRQPGDVGECRRNAPVVLPVGAVPNSSVVARLANAVHGGASVRPHANDHVAVWPDTSPTDCCGDGERGVGVADA